MAENATFRLTIAAAAVATRKRRRGGVAAASAAAGAAAMVVADADELGHGERRRRNRSRLRGGRFLSRWFSFNIHCGHYSKSWSSSIAVFEFIRSLIRPVYSDYIIRLLSYMHWMRASDTTAAGGIYFSSSKPIPRSFLPSLLLVGQQPPQLDRADETA